MPPACVSLVVAASSPYLLVVEEAAWRTLPRGSTMRPGANCVRGAKRAHRRYDRVNARLVAPSRRALFDFSPAGLRCAALPEVLTP